MVAIIMGSVSDLEVMRGAAEALTHLEVAFELTVISAHRTPERLLDFSKKASDRGVRAIIAGAGGAAHLPGMAAAVTVLPVIGVPVLAKNTLQGWDALLSIVQMPKGVPVATVALNGAWNAGILAAQIVGVADKDLQRRLQLYKEQMQAQVADAVQDLRTQYPNYYDK